MRPCLTGSPHRYLAGANLLTSMHLGLRRCKSPASLGRIPGADRGFREGGLMKTIRKILAWFKAKENRARIKRTLKLIWLRVILPALAALIAQLLFALLLSSLV
jgi:hypothetical protein